MEKKKTVLIVEDDMMVRDMYSQKLAAEGYSVRKAEDGGAGLSEAISFRPDLILLDVVMPKMNGYDMLRKLREHDEWGAHVPVVMLTNDDPDQESELNSIETLKPSYFLLKSSTVPEDLITKVREIIGS